MKKFIIILKYEFLKQVQTKAFKVVTLFLVATAIVGSFFLTRSSNGDIQNQDQVVEKIAVYENGNQQDFIDDLTNLGIYEITIFDSEKDLKAEVIENKVTGLVVNNYWDIDIIVASTSITGSPSQLPQRLNTIYQNKLLRDKGLQAQETSEIQNAYVDIEMINLGLDGFVGYGYAYTFTLLLYMMVVMYGNIISSSIVAEKTSKAMELLITSAKSTALVSGKVIGVGLSSILQISIVIATLLVSIKIFANNETNNPIFEALANVPLETILMAIFLFIVGFFSILFLFAGFSSFATKPEDASVVMTPLTMLIVGIFFLVVFGMTSGILDTTIVKILSFVPIFSPFLLFTRYVLFGLTTIEIVFGVFINIAGAVALIYFAAKIYRAGTLYYGNVIKFSRIFKSIYQ